jgi:hypothetical protein
VLVVGRIKLLPRAASTVGLIELLRVLVVGLIELLPRAASTVGLIYIHISMYLCIYIISACERERERERESARARAAGAEQVGLKLRVYAALCYECMRP